MCIKLSDDWMSLRVVLMGLNMQLCVETLWYILYYCVCMLTKLLQMGVNKIQLNLCETIHFSM